MFSYGLWILIYSHLGWYAQPPVLDVSHWSGLYEVGSH